jgi:hypothetical protein
MTPKEKAKELHDHFLPYCDDQFIAKEGACYSCCMIEVDEILTILDAFFDDDFPEVIFWKEVKQEIENL